MCGRHDDFAAFRQASSSAKLGNNGPQIGTRLNKRQKEMAGQVESVEDSVRPIASIWVEHLSGARIGCLVDLVPRKLPVEEIRNHQKVFSDVELGRILDPHTPHLVEGIDLHELKTAVGEDLFTGQPIEGLVHQPTCSGVPIAERGANQVIIAIQEDIVHTPSINPDACDSVAKAVRRLAKPFFDVPPQTNDIPMQSSPDMNGNIFKPMDIVKLDSILQNLSSQNSAAGCS